MKHHDDETKDVSPLDLAKKLFLYTIAGVILYGLAVLIFAR
jgi:hypothetical protein